VAKPIFGKNQYTTFSVEKGAYIQSRATSEIFKKTTQRKPSPKRRKFAQTGHPASETFFFFLSFFASETLCELAQRVFCFVHFLQRGQRNRPTRGFESRQDVYICTMQGGGVSLIIVRQWE
jgi:hypothetical protein